MLRSNGLVLLIAVVLIFAGVVSGPYAAAQAERVLHSFDSGDGGNTPSAGLISDGAGDLYGTTEQGGVYGDGTVFELTPNGMGGWRETVLHHFGGEGDGMRPIGGVVFDAIGNLYGTTYGGGAYLEGAAFELSPGKGDAWRETILHSFGSGVDGAWPTGSLVADAAGNFYGTTVEGGSKGLGTVFELSAGGSGWTESVIHDFSSAADGVNPNGGLVFDSAGNLYGTTFSGGGTVFELLPATGGVWSKILVHAFSRHRDGSAPNGGLVIDGAGNLYGTTMSGGNPRNCGGSGCGTAFQMIPSESGVWTERILHDFDDNETDGYFPAAGLLLDGSGTLYGTTQRGGSTNSCDEGSCGTVFSLKHIAGAGWREQILFDFNASGDNAALPQAGLIVGSNGKLYGTTTSGGVFGDGTVFEIMP
jgi:uncharacterized repeat protein (TIGR03803 family)